MRQKKINKMAFAEMLWDNYYTLATTPIQAMAIIWDEYANGNLAFWARTEHGIDDDALLKILCILTAEMRQMDLSKTAMETVQ